MAALAVNLQDAFTRVGTEFKAIRTLVGGSGTSNISALNTTDKSSLVAAINEVRSQLGSAGASNLDGLSDVAIVAAATGHILWNDGSQFVNVLGTSKYEVAGAAATAQSNAIAASQPVDSDLTAIAALTTTAYGRTFLTLANQAALAALMPASSDTTAGIERNATQAETNAGTLDTAAVTPLKLQTRLAAYAQPLDSDLTSIAALTTTTFGRSLLTQADATATKTTLGLAAVATSGSASDITTGTLPTSVLPPLAINETFTAASQAAMLALTAQRGDVAIRTDNGRTYILSTDSPSTLADWKQITASGDVTSVAGRAGNVVLTSADVGLGNVTNVAQQPLDTDLTAIAALSSAADMQPYATGIGTWSLATLTAFARTLNAAADAAAARGVLSVWSQAEVGSVTTDFVATFVAALA